MNKIKIFIVMIWLIAILVTISRIVILSGEYGQSKKEYEQYEKEFVKKVENPKKNMDTAQKDSNKNRMDENKTDAPVTVDFQSLKTINSEIVGWIYMEGTKISYPIVQGKDNSFYLNHTVDGSDNASGAIFLDCNNKPDFSDPNSILYGHNMKNGSMFRKLLEYLTGDAYQKSPYFWILTPENNWKYEIQSVFTAKINSFPHQLFEQRDDGFKEFLQNMKQASAISISEEHKIMQAENVITLSTCNGNSQSRTVVQGIRLW